MQLSAPIGSIDQSCSQNFSGNGMAINVALSQGVVSRLTTVDQLVNSNNSMDTLLSIAVAQAENLNQRLSALADRYKQLCAVVVEIDGEEITLGELAEKKAQLTEALTFRPDLRDPREIPA